MIVGKPPQHRSPKKGLNDAYIENAWSDHGRRRTRRRRCCGRHLRCLRGRHELDLHHAAQTGNPSDNDDPAGSAQTGITDDETPVPQHGLGVERLLLPTARLELGLQLPRTPSGRHLPVIERPIGRSVSSAMVP